MSQKSINTIGIEYDNLGIRAARMNCSMDTAAGAKTKPTYKLLALEEVTGSFIKDEDLVVGLKKIRDKLNIGTAERTVSCISGKQVFVAQITMTRLPANELRNALKLEIRKSLPFDVSGATIDYQVLPETDKKSETLQVMVTAVANVLIHKHLQLLSKAGIKPDIVDTLSTAMGNAFYAGAQEAIEEKKPCVVVHIGQSVCTLIIEGLALPFFHRNIYFSTEELYGVLAAKNPQPERERLRRLNVLTEEVTRSVSYYEKTYNDSGIQRVFLLGEYTDKTELIQAITEKTGLQGTMLDLCPGYTKLPESSPPAKFAVAIALGMRVEN
jgi:Tfp pilus assembly PilM family ATPase